jgi:hypothetical protein
MTIKSIFSRYKFQQIAFFSLPFLLAIAIWAMSTAGPGLT